MHAPQTRAKIDTAFDLGNPELSDFRELGVKFIVQPSPLGIPANIRRQDCPARRQIMADTRMVLNGIMQKTKRIIYGLKGIEKITKSVETLLLRLFLLTLMIEAMVRFFVILK
jgi:hypothetical protein